MLIDASAPDYTTATVCNPSHAQTSASPHLHTPVLFQHAKEQANNNREVGFENSLNYSRLSHNHNYHDNHMI